MDLSPMRLILRFECGADGADTKTRAESLYLWTLCRFRHWIASLAYLIGI